MPEFLLKLDIKDRESLGAVRCMSGLQAATKDDFIWVKGVNALIEIDKELMRLPVINTFITDEHHNLFLSTQLTPVAKLETLDWQPLTEFPEVESPVASLPGRTNAKVKIKLVSSSAERKGAALLTTLDIWTQYGETAPGSRLLATKFAVSENKEVLIVGEPLPPVPGIEYWRTGDVFIPCGYDFELSIMREFINKKINDNKGFLVLFDKNGNWQRIDKTFLVMSKRSAVRLTTIND